jgi:hypothetical protein
MDLAGILENKSAFAYQFLYRVFHVILLDVFVDIF